MSAPDNEDMRLIYDVVLEMDGQATEGGQSAKEIAGTVVDMASLYYLAQQRADRGGMVLGVVLGVRERVLALSMYLEAFVIGARFAKRRVAVRSDARLIMRYSLIDAEDRPKGDWQFDTEAEAIAEARKHDGWGVVANHYAHTIQDLVWSPEWEKR